MKRRLESAMYMNKNIVHSDIKGDNILIGHDGVVKLTDFGLSSCEADLQQMHDIAIAGALCWKAPEFKSGECGSYACDVYSFGMTQKFPYGTIPDVAIINRVKRNLHTLPKQSAEMTDSQWSLIKRMCCANPDDRTDMSTVVQELKAFAQEEQINNLQKEWETGSDTTTDAFITMDQVKRFCSTMQEAEALCIHIYSRLDALGQHLSSITIEKETLQHGYTAILERFHAFLG